MRLLGTKTNQFILTLILENEALSTDVLYQQNLFANQAYQQYLIFF